MAFGIVGVIIEMFLFGKLLSFVYSKCFKNKEGAIPAFLYAYLLLYVFYSVRSSVLLSIKNYLIGVLPVIIIYLIFRKSFKKEAAENADEVLEK